MKSIDKMSPQELRNELKVQRPVRYLFQLALERIEAGDEGCLLATYQQIATRALDAAREQA
jgi:hypothetical protein